MQNSVFVIFIVTTIWGCGIIQTTTRTMPNTSADLEPEQPEMPSEKQKRPRPMEQAPVATMSPMQEFAASKALNKKAIQIRKAMDARQISVCDALPQLRELEKEIPRDLLREYKRWMAIPDEGIPGVVSSDKVTVARAMTGKNRVELEHRIRSQFALSIPSHREEYVNVLKAIDIVPYAVYNASAALAIQDNPNTPPKGTPEELRLAAADAKCLGNYTPSPTAPSGTEMATVMLEVADRYEQQLQAQSAAESECQADPKCVQERELAEVLADLCSYLDDRKEVEARLQERKRNARQYGIINTTDQADDLEAKQDLDEFIATEKERYREITGKRFLPKACK